MTGSSIPPQSLLVLLGWWAGRFSCAVSSHFAMLDPAKVSYLVVLPCRPLEVWTELATWKKQQQRTQNGDGVHEVKQSVAL